MQQAISFYIAVQSLLFAIALFSRRKLDSWPLFIYFIITAVPYSLYSLITAYPALRNSSLFILIFDWVGCCKLPVLIYYGNKILGKPFSLRHHYVWAVPVASLFLLVSIYFLFYPSGTIILYRTSAPFISIFAFINLCWIILPLWQLNELNTAFNTNANSYTHYQRINFYWGRWLFYFQIARAFVTLIVLALVYTAGPSSGAIEVYYGIISGLMLILLLAVLGYLSLRNPAIFNEPEITGTLEQKLLEIVLPKEEKIVSKKVSLSPEATENYLVKLKKIVEDEKVYLDNELTQSKLAKLTNIPQQHLSYFINTHWNKNFHEFINSYRVQYAKTLLDDHDEKNAVIYAIALESGFNSERTFYTVFKQATGFTPKQYRMQQQKSAT